jgi:hypothetical protein
MIKPVAAKSVLRLLTEEQKNKHVNVCHDWQEQLKNYPQFLTKVATGNEGCCYGYDSHVKTAVKSAEVTKFAQTKKSTVSSLKCQDNVDFFS